ncbi:histidine kinase [Mycobacterium sp. 852002-51057_SCH5723018]|uniref:histidine kinase n=1 Tax=Mycobacterium sp. 852002-51057_SCH5723018 TaxID=1834094 RepID=UPI0008006963|nr:histidine kinase [Mycobacterium sp. 852002-51057_SCH5723018]OBG22110.1 histidine kinase [Mycobacterium sp. 852002-51057_SCH5723018]
MDLQPYVDAVRHELTVAAAAGGAEAQELAERLSAPLESAMRLALLEAVSAAAEEITRELAPRSVEVRLRGRDPEFIVTAALDEAPDEDAVVAQYDDDGGTWRVTLRLPAGLRPGVEAAARREGASLNSWLVRAAAVASQGASQGAANGNAKSDAGRPARTSAHRVTGWVR